MPILLSNAMKRDSAASIRNGRIEGTCKCCDGYEVDKIQHDTLQENERIIDAFHALRILNKKYSGRFLQNDPGFVETFYRWNLMRNVYSVLDHDDWVTNIETPLGSMQENLSSTGILDDWNSNDGCCSEPLRTHCCQERPMCSLYQQFNESNVFFRKSVETLSPCRPVSPMPFPRVFSGSRLESALKHQRHPLVTATRSGPWQRFVDEGEDMRIDVRNYSDNLELLTFRLEGVVDAPLLAVLSVLNEVDLFKSWVPYYTTPFKLGLRAVDCFELGRVDKTVQFHVDFPWPFANRDAFFEVWAVDDFERNDQVFVKLSTIDQGRFHPKGSPAIPQPAKGVERIIVDGSLVIKPLGNDAAFLSLVWHENCRMRVPMKMVEFVSKMFARKAFNSFRATCREAMTGVHKQRRLGNPFLYRFVENRLAELGLINTMSSLKIENSDREHGESCSNDEFLDASGSADDGKDV